MATLGQNPSERFRSQPQGIEQDGGPLMTPDVASMSPEALEELAAQKRREQDELKVKDAMGSTPSVPAVMPENTTLVEPKRESDLVSKAKNMLNDFFQGKRSLDDTHIDEGNAASIMKALENIENQKPQ
jgi:hypothetical protein